MIDHHWWWQKVFDSYRQFNSSLFSLTDHHWWSQRVFASHPNLTHHYFHWLTITDDDRRYLIPIPNLSDNYFHWLTIIDDGRRYLLPTVTWFYNYAFYDFQLYQKNIIFFEAFIIRFDDHQSVLITHFFNFFVTSYLSAHASEFFHNFEIMLFSW